MAVETLVMTDGCKNWALEKSPASPQKALIGAIEWVVKRGVDLGKPALVLQGDSLKRICTALGKAIDSPEGLAEAVEQALSLRLGGGEVKLDLTLSQLKALKGQALDSRLEPEAHLAALVDKGVKAQLGW